AGDRTGVAANALPLVDHETVTHLISALASPGIHSALASRLRPSARIPTPAAFSQHSPRRRLCSNCGPRLSSKCHTRVAANALPLVDHEPVAHAGQMIARFGAGLQG